MPEKRKPREKRKVKNPNGQHQNDLEKFLRQLADGVLSLAEGQKQLQATVSQLVGWQQQTQGIIAQLAEGQQYLQQAVVQLTEENRRLSEGQQRLQEAVAQLTEENRRLAEENRRLAEGQQRLQETVAQLTKENRRLAEGQQRLQEAVAGLAEGQQRLQETVAQLSEENRKMTVVLKEVNRKVGRLDEQWGMTVEGVAQIFLPSYLERHYGIKLKGKLGYELRPMFFRLNGEWEQVDLYGEGRMGDEEICIVCECKAKIYGRDVYAFVKKFERVRTLVKRRPIPVMFGYSIHPSAEEPASSHEILLVSPLIPKGERLWL
ncbi:MAG: hypothetical protein ACK4I8_06570 [Armatimonadota bacterium]